METIGLHALLGLVLLVAFVSVSHSVPDPDAELRRQQEREMQLRRRNTPQPEVRMQAAVAGLADQRLPEQETPCFQIDAIALRTMDVSRSTAKGKNRFPWAVEAANYTGTGESDTAIGRCLGAGGINLVMRRIQNAIVSKGYVTTRVLAGPQNLQTGELVLTVILGHIRDIRFTTPSPRVTAGSAIPSRPGELLNLRDIEQGLENFKRVPSVVVDMEIYPSADLSARPGDSDLVISWKQESLFRFTVSADNSGSESTGEYQGGLTVSYDNGLTLNDLFYLSLNNDLGGGSDGARGTRGNTVHYSVPYGYWLLGFTASRSRYHQTVATALANPVYSGDSRNFEVRLSRMVYRDANRKTQWHLAGWKRASRNYIDDTEVEVQRRRMAGLEFGINHREYIDSTTLGLGLSYRRGTGASNPLRAPEENFGEGTSRPKIIRSNASLSVPFTLWGQQLTYQNALQAQWNRTPLVPQDRFSIGSRYTVRGFDGENTLSGDRGWFIRNDIVMRLGNSTHTGYLGADYGSVDGQSSEGLIGKHLGGAALGFRGSLKGLNYDMYLAASLKKPQGFVSDDGVFNFNLNFTF